jgi:maltooligosyltrehalose trehalohydrolase
MNELRLGAVPLGDGTTEVRVWAPTPTRVAVRSRGAEHELAPEGDGFHAGVVPCGAGDDYLLVADGHALPDPCSRWQPEGVKGRSRVLDTDAFAWTDGGWEGVALDELVLYELHVGAFTQEGTFDAVIPRLRGLRKLGVTAIELMPVATFPGSRGWGYDGLYVFAPHPAYGGPTGLARLVDAAHAEGLAVVLDVVYNHTGPGNEALLAFGPYVGRTRTFWGSAPDFAQLGVREWAIQNAELWVRDYHVDALRLDAVTAIEDESVPHVCAELAARVRTVSPRALVISEAAVSDRRPIEEWGHDLQWCDAVHHGLHVLLTGEREGYYRDYGSVAALAEDLRGRGRDPRRLVVCAQNHDQVGNRAHGDRLPPDVLRVAAAVTLFSLSTPLLFMGEEYLERNPFLFFSDHIDPGVAQATRSGRKREFQAFAAFAGVEVPDPQALETFLRSKLDPREPDPLYGELLSLRPELAPELETEADDEAKVLTMRRGSVQLVVDFAARTVELSR